MEGKNSSPSWFLEELNEHNGTDKCKTSTSVSSRRHSIGLVCGTLRSSRNSRWRSSCRLAETEPSRYLILSLPLPRPLNNPRNGPLYLVLSGTSSGIINYHVQPSCSGYASALISLVDTTLSTRLAAALLVVSTRLWSSWSRGANDLKNTYTSRIPIYKTRQHRRPFAVRRRFVTRTHPPGRHRSTSAFSVSRWFPDICVTRVNLRLTRDII